MPPILMRLFSAQEPLIQNPDERGEELKITLGISGKPALSVTELEKQLLQPASSQQSTKPKTNTDNLAKPVPIPIQVFLIEEISKYLIFSLLESHANSTSSYFISNYHSSTFHSYE